MVTDRSDWLCPDVLLLLYALSKCRSPKYFGVCTGWATSFKGTGATGIFHMLTSALSVYRRAKLLGSWSAAYHSAVWTHSFYHVWQTSLGENGRHGVRRTSPLFGCPRWQRRKRWRWFPWRSPQRKTGWPGPDQDAGTTRTQLKRIHSDMSVIHAHPMLGSFFF